MTPRGARPALAGLTAIAWLIVIGFSGAFGAQSRHPILREERLSRTLTFSDTRDRLLEVSTINGAIRIIGHDAESVEVAVRKTVRAETDTDAAVADRTAPVAFSELAGTIRVGGDAIARPGCDEKSTTPARREARYVAAFDFEIRAPRQTRLRVCTVNGGDIHVEGMAADFDVDHVNGGITLTNVRGSGRAVTVNGDVEASFATAPQAPLLFRSVNGDLQASFPRDLSADLRLKTFNGELYTDFEVISLPSTATAERRNGAFVYRSNRFGGFRVGRGGPALTFDAFNGDVRVLARP